MLSNTIYLFRYILGYIYYIKVENVIYYEILEILAVVRSRDLLILLNDNIKNIVLQF